MARQQHAIRVKNLGKKYRIGGQQEKYLTFRDAIINSIKAPLRRISSSDPLTEFWALQNVSFNVDEGEVIGIIGRNGAGKSTLLKILSRITTPTEGRVEISGRVGSLLEVGTGFHPELSGRENIFLSGSLIGMKKREIDFKFDEIVKFSELEQFLDTPVKRYSSGMYIRLAFAVAAHLEPEILLVDEVLAVGDAAFQKKCLGKMGDVAKTGRTVLFVSHNMAAIQRLCHTAILLEKGQIEAQGDVYKVTETYLKKGFESSSFWERSTLPLEDAYFTKVSLTDEDYHPIRFVSVGSKVVLVIEFIVEKDYENLQLAINITTHYGEQLLSSSPEDIGILTPNKKGHYQAIVSLPTNIFLAKNYGVTVSLYLPMKKGLDHIDSLNFSVQETDCWSNRIIGGRAGHLAVPCQWEIQNM